jgi:hypothetical protein
VHAQLSVTLRVAGRSSSAALGQQRWTYWSQFTTSDRLIIVGLEMATACRYAEGVDAAQ